MISIRRAVALAAAVCFAPAAFAHEGGVDARGAVHQVSATQIVVETPDGKTKSFAVTPGTEVRRGNSVVKITDVVAGEKVVVHAKKAQRGNPEATSIRVAKDQAAPK
jgi:hypothetical protein